MTAGKYNGFVIEQGATFNSVLTLKDSADNLIDLTGYTARMHIRTSYDAATTIIELTTANSRIALGGAAGTVTLTIDADDTDDITAGVYVYDLELISGTTVTRWLQGTINVTREVTR